MQQTRKIRIRLLLLVSLTVLLSLVPVVFAVDETDEINLLDVPHQLGVALGIGDFSGGILASGLVMMSLILPVLVASKGKSPIAVFVVSVLGLGICVSFAWLSPWFLIIIVFLIALLFGDKIKGVFT